MSYGLVLMRHMAGTVASVDHIDDNACGKSVKLHHDHNITSQYCHLDNAVPFVAGTEVEPGEIIGYMGSTGASTGVHLHFAIYVYGIPVDPRTFMAGEPSL